MAARSTSKAAAKAEGDNVDSPDKDFLPEPEHGDYSEYLTDGVEPDFDAPEQNAKEVSA